MVVRIIARSASSIVEVRFAIVDLVIQIVAGPRIEIIARSAYSIVDVRFAT